METSEINSTNGPSFLIKLQKNDSFVIFSSESKSLSEEFAIKLRKCCLLHDFSETYQKFDLLGSGHFANVYFAKHNASSKDYAAKIIRKDSKEFEKQRVLLNFLNFHYVTNFFPELCDHGNTNLNVPSPMPIYSKSS